MKSFRGMAALLVALIGFVGGSIAAFYANQLHKLQKNAALQPHEIKAEELASKGVGSNAHLRITGLKFGKPVIEEDQGRWTQVWLPITAAGVRTAKTSTPTLFFVTRRIHSSAELDALTSQTTLEAFASNTALGDSIWGSEVTDKLYSAYPEMDFDKTIHLTDVGLQVPFTSTVVGNQVLFSEMNFKILLGIGILLIVVGLVAGLFAISVESSMPAVRIAACKVDQTSSGQSISTRYISTIPASMTKVEEIARLRELVVNESPRGTYRCSPAGLLQILFVVPMMAITLLAILGLIIIKSASHHIDGAMIAAIAGMMAMFASLGISYFLGRNLLKRSQSVSVVQICPSGLRWTKGSHVLQAAWSEIAMVERHTIDTDMKKAAVGAQFGLVGALAVAMSQPDPSNMRRTDDSTTVLLQTGEMLYFSMSNTSEYSDFAANLHEIHGNEARRIEFDVEHQIAAGRFQLPGGTSRATMLNFRSS